MITTILNQIDSESEFAHKSSLLAAQLRKLPQYVRGRNAVLCAQKCTSFFLRGL